jgi:5-formaminoimidazole-4-carboxamide-1-(beta)-D-ribofuranosyl 5'-monophosphate synthetase
MVDMLTSREMSKVISEYDSGKITIGTLGSHSALDICRGAKDENFRTLVVCQKGREATYDRHYRTRKSFGRVCGVVDETILLDRFQKILDQSVQQRLLLLNTIFVPHRSFTVYVPYDGVEGSFRVPIFGSRRLLRAEEREADRNQYFLLEQAGVRTPRKFSNYREIDRLAIVKVAEAGRTFERAFFYASSPREFEERSTDLIRRRLITEDALEAARIEEFVVGTQYNFNFFYSPLLGDLELLGTDARRQTNLDGLLRLPADEQMKVLGSLKVRNIEVGHFPTTLRESLLEKVFSIGERFVEVTKSEYPPGIIGPFALQSAIVPGPPEEDIVVFDVSLRVPGSPGTKATHYTECLWGFPVSTGRRIAMEVRTAAKDGRLDEVVT